MVQILLSPLRPEADCAENEPFEFCNTEHVSGVVDTTERGSPELVVMLSVLSTPTVVFTGVANTMLCAALAPGRGAFIAVTPVETVRVDEDQYELPAKVTVN
jgi:hypothetical protein